MLLYKAYRISHIDPSLFLLSIALLIQLFVSHNFFDTYFMLFLYLYINYKQNLILKENNYQSILEKRV